MVKCLYTLLFKGLGSVKKNVLKEVSSAQQGCIYLIKNTVIL